MVYELLNFQTTQILKEHGCFESFLNRFDLKMRLQRSCQFCEAYCNDATHTLPQCPKWASSNEIDYFFDFNGTPIGSYEEASALHAWNSAPNRSFYCNNRHDSSPGFRRSIHRLVSAKEMGSNVSRHSGKGLSGRRAQSSGSLYRMLAPRVGRVFNPCGESVKQRDRNKFCGSLPNHLDEKQVSSGGSSPESFSHTGSNYDEIYVRANAKNISLLFQGRQDLVVDNQGYGSEWLPENDLTLCAESKFLRYSTIRRSSEVTFITKENTFEARLEKGTRGLGLSVTGGIDTSDQHPGLIRIKRLFPHQPAWECGSLELGDIILEANGIPLTGLTNHEALEVLRTTPSNVVLKICRPPCDTFSFPESAIGEPPPPPKRDPNQNVLLSSQSSNSNNKLPLPLAEPCGEFDVILNKVNGSLGFTLRKEDESVLGHYVRALVREPAISDGRIRPGDKIVSVNGRDISPMSHGEAVAFLRQCGDEVRLRLYRDPAQTPVSPLSPTESHKTFRPRPVLRKEAMDMLCTLAVRKLSPSDSRCSSARNRFRSTSPGSSPRRRKLTKTPDELRPLEVDSGSRDSASTEKKETHQMETLNHFEENELSAEKSEPVSMPPIPMSTPEFSYKNPIYQSAHPAIHPDGGPGKERHSDQDVSDTGFEQREGSQGLLKWKGVVFTAEEKNLKEEDQRRTKNILTVELCRGWNSRLGFSLRSSDSKTLISAIYPESVAAKDGRLRIGDEVIMINDEPTKGMTTTDVIDLLRKVRGAIAITVIRCFREESS